MSDQPQEDEVFETGALQDENAKETETLEGLPEDFEPDDDEDDEHSKENSGGPGGIINYDESLYPEDWKYVEGVSSPKVEG